ncbi:MAG: TonB-dependent receptor [Proteobacteria bacterium]|nr:TonB-dependent receptor [Pseudomonadota bacterium]
MKRLLATVALLASRSAFADDADADADAELRRMAEAQLADTIEIFDERPDKPFDRDTDVRLTGEQLAARGATDLAQALQLLPDVTVRDAGRGGFNIDVRGARKGSVTVLIDGVAVSDPFYGTFDPSSIPITDIVQIRVSTNLQSPIDGIGGPGGVIEIHTRDAIGPQVVVARVTGDSLPSFGMTGTARVALARYLALRVSASGLAGARDLPLPGAATLDEARHAATGAMRLEYRAGDRRVALDGFVDSRHYISPPSDTDAGDIVMIDRETSTRASLKIDDTIDRLQVQVQGWAHALARTSRHFGDYTLASLGAVEDLHAYRVGGLALATHPIGKSMRWATSVSVDRDAARVVDEAGAAAAGDVTVVEAAADLQYERRRLRVDVAGGLAVPFGVDAAPWPELKAVAKYQPRAHLELALTAGHKGRVPTLRERFDLGVGNPKLAPEKTWQAELRATEQVDERLRLELAPYARSTTGTIRQIATPDPADDPMRRIQANLDRVTILGVDASARVRPHRLVELGGSFGYIHARSSSTDPALAMTPLDRLPAYRADGWVQVTPTRRLTVLARARYFGTTLESSNALPAYTLLEATVTAPISKAYLAVLRVDDATDVRPETRSGYHAIGRIVSVMVQGTWE